MFKENPPRIRYCLFDMDGLLLDTERVYTEVTSEIVGKFGKEFSWSLKSRMMGRKEQDAAELLISELGIPMTAAEYLKERNAGHEKKFPHCRPLPGVIRLVKHLKKNNIPIAVATSSHTAAFRLKSQNNMDLFSLFDVIVCGDDPAVKHGKPAPDLFLEAARRLGHNLRDCKDCLVFEDASSGVKAALAAQMHVVWVPDPNLLSTLQNDDPLLSQATQVLQPSLIAFNPDAFGLPPFPPSANDEDSFPR